MTADSRAGNASSTPGASWRALVAQPRIARGKRRLIMVLVATDLLAVLAAGLVATAFRFQGLDAPVATPAFGQTFTFVELTFAALPLWLVSLYLAKLYDVDRLLWGAGEMSRVGAAGAGATLGIISVAFLLKLPFISRAWLVLFLALASGLVMGGRFVVREVVAGLRRRGRLLERTLVVGDNEEARHLVDRLRRDPAAGLLPVGYAGVSESAADPDLPRLGSIRDIPRLIAKHEVDTVLVASTSLPGADMMHLLNELKGLPVQLHISSGLYQIMTSRVLVRDVAGVPLVTVKGLSLTRVNLAVKRAFDIAVSLLATVVLAPVWVPCAVLIKATSRGPLLYRQTRTGRHGIPFEMFKFRSMVGDADARLAEITHLNERDGHVFKAKGDPRVTRIGWFIRKFSIDELPQVINVLRSEMSLVGPRPPLPTEVEKYEEWHRRRFEVLPGMTGLWQVSGRADISFDEMVRLDIYYIENWSVKFDLGIIMRTVPVVLLGRGAY